MLIVETREELVKTLNTPVGTLQPMVELSTSDDAIQVYSDGELEKMCDKAENPFFFGIFLRVEWLSQALPMPLQWTF